MRRFAVIGPAQSGKTTFAEALAKVLGTTCRNTSDWLVEVEAARYASLHGDQPKTICLGCGRDKDEGCDCPCGTGMRKGWDHTLDRPARPWLIALGDAVCDQQPDFLIEQALKGGGVITGIRRELEFEALPPDVVTVYVHRPGFAKEQDNFGIEATWAKHCIVNEGSVEDLIRLAKDLGRTYLTIDLGN